jgi:hypothetical protein
MSRAVYRQLKLLVRRHRAPFVEVQRARIVLLARDGVGTGEIARAVGCTDRAVRKWKARFTAKPTPEGLQDAPRTGRPATVPVYALAGPHLPLNARDGAAFVDQQEATDEQRKGNGRVRGDENEAALEA